MQSLSFYPEDFVGVYSRNILPSVETITDTAATVVLPENEEQDCHWAIPWIWLQFTYKIHVTLSSELLVPFILLSSYGASKWFSLQAVARFKQASL